ncbi:MAG: RagB/SusD family nutrient uptake outer membrane protein [Prevotella sp.]|nr:RagB/SusD family nutrient uptake outer membrane protein [Prevotella sp.]
MKNMISKLLSISKKTAGLLLLFLGTCQLTSCLEENPRDRLTEDEAFNSAENLFINAVATLYNHIGGNSDSQGLQGTDRGVYDLQTFSSDEAMLPRRGGDWYDGGLWQSLYLHTWNAGCSATNDTWFYLYKVIVLCNQSLEHLEKYRSLLTDKQYEALNAEVRALRAMYYCYLLDLYGRVPYITSTNIDFAEATQMERSDLFKAIYMELTDVLPKLSPTHSNLKGEYYGRITQPVVSFLLAKMALNAEVWMDDNWTDNVRPDGKTLVLPDGMKAWEGCIYWCDMLSISYFYELEKDYNTNFSVHNSKSVENIFVIPTEPNTYTNEFNYLFRSRHYNHGAALGMASENGTSATVSTVKTYGYGTDYVDRRFNFNFYAGQVWVDGQLVTLDNGQPLYYDPLAVELDLTGLPYEDTAGARMSKYEVDRTALSDGKLQDNDIVLFRYADVLLMKAEAKVRNGQDGSAELNKVRNRVDMEDRPATLDNILDERLMELAWEGWRRQDLIRFDRFHQAYDQRPQLASEVDRHTIVFPIPVRVVALNPNNRQNPGY